MHGSILHADLALLTRAGSRGFTLIEILVTLGILAVLGAIIVPALRPRIDHAHASAIIESLNNIRQATYAYRDDVGWYPSTLTQLQARPAPAVAPMTSICSGIIIPGAHFTATWRGPYLTQRIELGGLQVGNSTVASNLAYDPLEAPPGSGLAQIVVSVSNVDRAVWEIVDVSYDGVLGLSDGAIRWTESSPGSQAGILSYFIRIRGC